MCEKEHTFTIFITKFSSMNKYSIFWFLRTKLGRPDKVQTLLQVNDVRKSFSQSCNLISAFNTIRVFS